MHDRTAILWGAILGATGVALGAFGAHALHDTLASRNFAGVWETAVHYQLFHAVALVGFAAWVRAGSNAETRTPVWGKAAVWTVRFWVVGTLLFSVSLYLLALGTPKIVGAITPFGGAALIAGWIAAALTARAEKPLHGAEPVA
jgi:uncharacterized membrane protein YgdD (TMEM256/DUF423 family)